MAKILDALGRNLDVDVKLTNVNELTQALLAGVKTRTTTKATKEEEESTDEIKEIKKLVQQVANCCKHIAQARNKVNIKNVTKEARIYAKAVAAEQRKQKGRSADPVTALSNNLKRNLNPALSDAADNINDLNVRLAKASGIMVRGMKETANLFAKDFKKLGSSMKGAWDNAIKKLGLDKMWDDIKAYGKEFWQDLKDTGAYIFGGVKKGFSAFWTGVKDVWDKTKKGFLDASQWVGKKLGEAWTAVTTTVGNMWTSITAKLGKMWTGIGGAFGKARDAVSGFISKFTGPLGTATQKVGKAFGQVAGFFSTRLKPMKDAIKEAADALRITPQIAATANAPGGSPGTGTIPGAEPPPGGRGRARGRGKQAIMIPEDEFSPLCACICRCLGKPIQKMSKSQDAETRLSRDGNKGIQEVAKRIPLLGKLFTDPKRQTKREKAAKANEAYERLQRAKDVKEKSVGFVDGVRQWLTAEDPFKVLWQKASGFAGKAIEAPFKILASVLETEIFGWKIPFLGEVTRMFGGALGGLTEGIMGFIGDEMKDYQEQSQALYTTRGSTGGKQGRAEDSILPPNAEQASINIENMSKGLDIVAKKQEMFHRSTEDILETGQRLSKLRERDIKNFKKGITDFKKVTNIGLNTASQIQADADQTGEIFAGWKTKLGASNYQLGIMGRGMLDVARSTGVFGEQLLEAAKNSEAIMKNMRAYGTFSAKAGTNIIGLMAAAEKAGVSEGMQNVLGVLQSSLIKGGKGTALANLGIGNSGKVRDQLIGGTILKDKGAQKELAKNWRKFLDGLSQSMFGTEYSKLTEGQKGLMAPTVESITQGVVKGPEELNQIINVFEERSIGFADSMKKLDPKLSKFAKGLTDAELAVQKQALLFNTGAEIIDDFDQALKRSGNDASKAFANIQNDDLKPFLKNIESTGKGANAVGDILKKQAQVIRERAKQSGMADKLIGTGIEEGKIDETIEKAMRDLIDRKDTKAYEDLKDTLTTLDNKTREQMRRNADPVTKIMTTLFQIEAWLKLGVTSLISEFMPLLSGWLSDFEGQEFFKDFAAGNTEEAIRKLGEYLKNIPGRFTKGANEAGALRKAGRATGSQAFLAGALDGLMGEGSPIGFMISKFGKLIEDNAKLITDAIKEIEKQLKSLNENMQMIGYAFGALIGISAILMGAAAIGGVISILGGVGIAGTLIGGLAVLAAVIAGGALIYGLYELSKALDELEAAEKRQLELSRQKQALDTHVANKAIKDNKEQALAGNVAALEAKRAQLIAQETEFMGKIQKLEAKGGGLFGRTSTEDVTLADTKHAVGEIGRQKADLDEQLKTAKVKEAEAMKTMGDKEKANKQMSDWWSNKQKSEANLAAQRRDIENQLAENEKILKDLEGVWFKRKWTKDNIEMRKNIIEELKKRHEAAGPQVVGDKWGGYRTGTDKATVKESAEEQFIRQRYLITAQQQSTLGIKDRGQLGAAYSQLGDILWEKGSEEALNYVRKNAKNLNMNIVQAMFENYGKTLPQEFAKSVTTIDYKAMNALMQSARTGKHIKPTEGISEENYLKATEVAKARGAAAPEIQDLLKVINDPNAVKLSKEQLDYLLKIEQVKQREIDFLKQRLATEDLTAQGKSHLQGDIKAREAALNKNILNNATPKPAIEKVEEMADAATKKHSIYTHDTHVEKLLEQFVGNTVAKPLTTLENKVTPLFPSLDADDEIKKQQIDKNDGKELAQIEASTSETAINTRKIASAINNLAKALSRRKRSGVPIESSVSEDPFMNEILNTEWPNARQNSTVGIEFDITDIS